MRARAADPLDRLQLLRPADAAAALGVCVRTVHRLIRRGSLPAFRAGDVVRVPARRVREMAARVAGCGL